MGTRKVRKWTGFILIWQHFDAVLLTLLHEYRCGMPPFRKIGVRDYKPALSSLCESVPGKKQLLQHLSQSSALRLSSYLKHISRNIIISFFCGAKVIAPCCIWCDYLQKGHHKSWNGNRTRRIAAVPWGLRAVLMGWNSKKIIMVFGGYEIWNRGQAWSSVKCFRMPRDWKRPIHCSSRSEVT